MYEKLLSDTFPGFLSIRNEKHQIIYLNDNFKNWIRQFTDIDPLGKTNVELSKIVPQNVADTFMQCHDGSLDLYSSMESGQGLKKVIEFKNEDGKKENSQYFDVFKYIVFIDERPHIYTLAYEITDLFKENQLNLYSSITDSMTGAYNRRYLEMNYEQFEGKLAVLFDLDNFKMINDYEGHTVGDSILCDFVKILNNIDNTMAAIRLGGDEFILIVEETMTKEKLDIQLNKVREEFEDKFRRYRYLSFTFGIDEVKGGLEEMLIALDKKMYHRKYMRKGNYQK